MTEHFDVIIVGSGAGGGTLAHTLAPSGKKILLLERGDFLPREMSNWDPSAVFVDGRQLIRRGRPVFLDPERILANAAQAAGRLVDVRG